MDEIWIFIDIELTSSRVYVPLTGIAANDKAIQFGHYWAPCVYIPRCQC